MSSNAKRWIILGVVGIFVLSIISGIYRSSRDSRLASLAKPFHSHLSEYIDILGPKERWLPILNDYVKARGYLQKTAGYISGKVVIVDINALRIDELMLDLPEDIVAVGPEEVQTVIWLDRNESTFEAYEHGVKATVKWCSITVIDKKQTKIIAHDSISGSQPPSTKRGYGPFVGTIPYDDVVKYIRGLPLRRPVKPVRGSRSPEGAP